MTESGRNYQYSGEYNPDGLFFMILAGILGTSLLSLVYSHALVYISFVYVNIIIIILYGAGTGWLLGKVAIWRKVRNPKLVTLMGFIFGLFAVYIGWISWIFVSSKYQLLLFDPVTIIELIKELARRGVWSLSSWTPTGIWLYLFWGIEALIIIIASTIIAGVTLTSEIFCEHCDRWVKEKEQIPPLEWIQDIHQLKSQLEHGDFSALFSLKKVSISYQIVSYTRVEIRYCERCQNLYLLNIHGISKGVDSKGREKESKTSIVENLVINYEIYQKLKNIKSLSDSDK